MGQQKTIAVDFDGVIHRYSKGWNDGSCYDEPVMGALEALNKLKRKGYRIIVFTARRDIDGIVAWFDDHAGWCPEITNTKPIAIAYIDDRAIRFTNWKDMLNYF